MDTPSVLAPTPENHLRIRLIAIRLHLRSRFRDNSLLPKRSREKLFTSVGAPLTRSAIYTSGGSSRLKWEEATLTVLDVVGPL